MIDSTHLDTLRDYIRRADVRGPMHAAVDAVLRDHHQRVNKGLPQAEPTPMILDCPFCHSQHIDEGSQATTAHRTHACQRCGRLWAPAVVPTVGVKFLPGCKNDGEPTLADASPGEILRGHHADCRIDTRYSWLPVHCAKGCHLNPLSRACPTCGAGVGAQCSSVNAPCTVGDFGPDFHEARYRRGGPLTRDQAVELLHSRIVATGQREREPPEWAVQAVLAASGAVEER